MKRFFESAVVRGADTIASELLKIPGVVLMENAGRGAAEVILEKYPEAANVLILCGPGNNGGDGFVAARHLKIHGCKPNVLATAETAAYKGDAFIMARAAENCGVPITVSKKLNDAELSEMIRGADLIVDALLGTGTTGAPRGEAERLIRLCSGAKKIAALDIPSGLDPDSGLAGAVAIRAQITTTFLAMKKGFETPAAKEYCGEVIVCNIGVPPELVLPSP